MYGPLSIVTIRAQRLRVVTIDTGLACAILAMLSYKSPLAFCCAQVRVMPEWSHHSMPFHLCFYGSLVRTNWFCFALRVRCAPLSWQIIGQAVLHKAIYKSCWEYFCSTLNFANELEVFNRNTSNTKCSLPEGSKYRELCQGLSYQMY